MFENDLPRMKLGYDTILPSCRNLPFCGRARQDTKVCLRKRRMCGSRHQRLFEENVRKTKRGLQISKKSVRELFTYREGISIPLVRHKGRQPLIECAKKRDFNIIYFPFLCFFIFWGRQGCCPCSYVSKVRWGIQTYVVLKSKKVVCLVDFKLLKGSF